MHLEAQLKPLQNGNISIKLNMKNFIIKIIKIITSIFKFTKFLSSLQLFFKQKTDQIFGIILIRYKF